MFDTAHLGRSHSTRNKHASSSGQSMNCDSIEAKLRIISEPNELRETLQQLLEIVCLMTCMVLYWIDLFVKRHLSGGFVAAGSLKSRAIFNNRS